MFGQEKVQLSKYADTTNREGFGAWSAPVEQRYLQMLMTNTFGNTFYAKAEQHAQEADETHDEMLARDPEFAAKALAYARNKGYMRTQCVYGLAKLFLVSANLGKSTFPQVIQTPDDLFDFMTINGSLRFKGPHTVSKRDRVYSGRGEGTPALTYSDAKEHYVTKPGQGGRAVKSAINSWLQEKLTEYWAIKYGADKGEGAYSLRDVIKTTHPAIDWDDEKQRYLWAIAQYILAKGKEKLVDPNLTPQLDAFERLKRETSDREKIGLIREGRIPHEQATPFAGKSAEVWAEIAQHMPIFALLRNLATLERKGVINDPEVKATVQRVLTNPSQVQKSKILPYRFVEAEKHVTTTWVKDALRDAVELSFDAIGDVPGDTCVLLDISNSMRGGTFHVDGKCVTYPESLEKARLFAMSLMKKASDNSDLYLFNTDAKLFPFSRRDSLLTQAKQVTANGGTNTGAAMQKVLDSGKRYDTLIMITDEQQNQGQPFYDVLVRYRGKVNPHLHTFIMNVAPEVGSVVPSQDPAVFHLYGWSDQILKLISLQSQGWRSMVEAVREGRP